MQVIISDIHGNFVALQAVLADIAARFGEDVKIRCLGDVIGYGPQPLECLRLVKQRCDFTILGNHDDAALFDPAGFRPVAEDAILWTRAILEGSKDMELLEFIGELPRLIEIDDVLYVHASPRKPKDEYIFAEDIYNEKKMKACFERVRKICFCGHTHQPGIFYENAPDFTFQTPDEVNGTFSLLPNRKYIINVGSVGQPRDNNPMSCYVAYDEESSTVTWHRVSYDVEVTANLIYDIFELDDSLGDRIKKGT